MFAKRIVTAAALIALTSGAAFAQAAAPAKPATTPAPPPVAAPAKPVVVAPAPVAAPVVAKTNLNTASAVDLEKLPQIGPARSKDIIEARTKTKFKDWADFMARKVVPSNAETAIKDLVSF